MAGVPVSKGFEFCRKKEENGDCSYITANSEECCVDITVSVTRENEHVDVASAS